jgi:hypothetical protein
MGTLPAACVSFSARSRLPETTSLRICAMNARSFRRAFSVRKSVRSISIAINMVCPNIRT